MGDDDSLLFVDNIVDVLSKYDHTKKHYIGTFSETIKSNVRFSFDMAYGGAGYALSYPLVKALVAKLEECIERYHFIWAGDQLQSFCLSDLGVDVTHEKGFHQVFLTNISSLSEISMFYNKKNCLKLYIFTLFIYFH